VANRLDNRRRRSLVLYKGLARAVRREGSAAVQHCFGVCTSAVRKWRRALGLPRMNEGDRRLRSAITKANPVGLRAMFATARDPVRRAKIAAFRRGKPRSPETIAKMRAANLGKRVSAKTRARMKSAAKLRVARGYRPPITGRAWTTAEDELVRTLSPTVTAQRTGRSIDSVTSRRGRLKKRGVHVIPVYRGNGKPE
jgi:hypothetical protein